ncbi:MAG TPA: thioredoxin [Acidimicrobiia bacterium]|nr:thioredoxin [Acidimicrobiia bacterium]
MALRVLPEERRTPEDPVSLITNVVRGSAADRLLLLVHGFGADERDLGGLLPYLDPEGRFVTVLPRGPVSSPGMPGFAWYDFGLPPAERAAAFAAALDQLDDLLDEAAAEHDLPRAEAIVGGFSQGAGLALALALRTSDRPHPLAVLALSPALAIESLDEIGPDWDAAAKIPVLLQHGTHDPLVPVVRSRELARELEEHGVSVVYTEYPMEHQVALESVQRARAWLDAVIAGERPSEPIPEPAPEGPVKPVTTADFEQEVLRSDVPVIVDFWAPWCGPCRQVSPIVEQIAVMREGAYKVVKINIDDEPVIAQQFQIQSIPLIGLFRNGRLERQSLGAKPRPQIEADLGMLVIP